MANFLNLVHNENVKIYRRVRTWVMLGLLVLITALVPVLISLTSETISVWDGIILTTTFTFFLNNIFTVIIAADSVAGEFTWGTIKLLLIRPWSRSKILLSKYVSVLLFSLLGTALLIAMNLLFSFISLSTAVQASSIPPFVSAGKYVALTFLCQYAALFVITALAFMLSAVFRSSGLAIGLSLFIMFTKNIFAGIFTPERFAWSKYVLFTHMDLTGYIGMPGGPNGMTLGFSLAVLAVYYIIFMAICWIVFVKRDVAA